MIVKNILILGAGLSSRFLIHKLLEQSQAEDWFVTVADRDIEAAKQTVRGNARGHAVMFEANDADLRATLIDSADVVVNLLTRPLQHLIALDCLYHGKSMVTASYEESAVRKLDNDANRRGILILNELGVDPGIDHMIAISLIHRVRSRGGIITSFHSYGGGLPAKESIQNPLNYAITWNPRNVLLAGEDGAIYKEKGKIKMLPFHEVFNRSWNVEVGELGILEAYPNRDALSYESLLGLEHAHTMIRGTLRYPGWSETWQCIVQLGLTNEILHVPGLKDMTYREMVEMFLPPHHGESHFDQDLATYLGISPTGDVMSKLRWLGLFSTEKIGLDVRTTAQVMTHLIREKLALPENGKDVVVLWHQICAEYENGRTKKERITHEMVEYGDPRSFSSISRTVGLPLSVAVRLILKDALNLTGCVIPTHPTVYEAILPELEKEGLVFKETTEVIE
jgi:saccharopine dehydrogenase-like NADP-dependent oxidoreductase